MFAKVAPIRRLPRSVQPYDYRIPEGLTVEVGSFVEITLRGKPERGVVTELMKLSNIKRLADVVRVYDVEPLSENDLAFYCALARRTYQSLSSILHAAIPSFLKRATTSVDLGLSPVSLSMSPDAVELLKKIVINELSTQHRIVSVPSDKFAISVVVSMLLKGKDPILVICPDINMMRELATAAASVTDKVAIFGGSMNKTQAMEGWNAIRSGSKRITIASRVGALIPPSANTGLVILACGEDDHSQSDQNPHYDVRWCVQARQATHKSTTLMLGTMPRIEDGELTIDGWTSSKAQIVNMDDSRHSSESYHVSDEAIEFIKCADTDSRPFFVYFNRKPGEYDKRTTNRDIASELKRIFPEEAISIVEAEDEIPPSGIVVITNTILYKMSYVAPVLSGMIILNAEQPFVYRGFRSLEKAVRVIRRLVSWSESGHAKVIIQTKNPSVVREALGDTSKIRDKELAMRERLNYPPFGDVHVLKTTEDIEIVESYRLSNSDALGEGEEAIVKLPTGEVVQEWFTYPPSCNLFVNPDK
jgi:primosomal protein N'